MKIYRIEALPYVFYARVQKIDDEETQIQFASSEYNDCLTIQIWKDYSIAELHGVIYDRLCASNIPLEKSSGTVIMIKAALKFVIKKFKYIESFDVTDNSQVDCGAMKVSLSDMNLLVFQNTWYERRFGAVSKYTLYASDLAKLRQAPTVDFDVLWDRYLQHGQMFFAKGKQEYSEMYMQSRSWAMFFHTWFQKEGCRPFLYLADYDKGIMRWLRLSTRAYRGKEWMIQRDTVRGYDVRVKAQKLHGTSIPQIEWQDVQYTQERTIHGGQMVLPIDVMYE